MRISNNPHILLLATMPYMYIVMLLIYLFLLETLYLARKSRLLPFFIVVRFYSSVLFCTYPPSRSRIREITQSFIFLNNESRGAMSTD